MKAHFDTFARFNAWANQRLYEAVGAIDDDEYRADRGVFFRSLHGTLNHLLASDRIWMRRITGTGDAPERLDAILFDDFASLRAAREAEDRRIVDHVGRLTEAELAGVIRYRRVSTPEVFEQPLGPALAHLFNHQTHHRGQAHAVLTGLGRAAPELDLLYFQRLSDAGQA
jgi:uncharacterized damage-inducible protein DinB